MSIQTPCTKVCALEPISGLCRGCGRTLDEIARWTALNDDQRARVMAELPQRMALLGARAVASEPA